MDVWNLGFDGVFAVLSGVDHSDSKEENRERKLYLSVKFGRR